MFLLLLLWGLMILAVLAVATLSPVLDWWRRVRTALAAYEEQERRHAMLRRTMAEVDAEEARLAALGIHWIACPACAGTGMMQTVEGPHVIN